MYEACPQREEASQGCYPVYAVGSRVKLELCYCMKVSGASLGYLCILTGLRVESGSGLVVMVDFFLLAKSVLQMVLVVSVAVQMSSRCSERCFPEVAICLVPPLSGAGVCQSSA